MPDEELQAFLKDFKSGTPVPPVDPADIGRMWEFVKRTRAEAVQHGVKGKIGFTSASMNGVCTPGANIGAVWARAAFIELLQTTGAIKALEPGSDLEKRVFDLLAIYPIQMGEFDGDEFLRRLHASDPKLP